jgi:RHS repeat-associated protein
VAALTSGTGLSYLVGDQQGTDSLAFSATTTALTRRYFDPYGNPIGPVPASFPAGQKGFIGGTDDSATGLTNLGAREYQPLSGSFVSPDPMQDGYDPQDLNAYSYATDNPTTMSDPTGASPVIPGPVRIPEPILTGSTGAIPTDVPGDQINGPHGCRANSVQQLLDCEHTVLVNDWK